METVLFGIGSAVARVLFRLWWENSESAQDASLSLKELARKAVSGGRDQRALGRELERIGDQIADRVSPFFEAEFGGLPENEKVAAGEEIRRTLEQARLSDAALFSVDLEPQALEAELRASRPKASEDAFLSDAGTAFYDLLLREVSTYIVEIRVTLPDFASQAARVMLGRETEILELVETVLERLPAGDIDLDGGEVAAFEAQYRRDVARKLDRLELFGVTTSELSRRYSLSVAYLTLNASARATSPRLEEPELEAKSGVEAKVIPAGERPDIDEEEDERVSFRVDAALADRNRVLIRGEAGSGKTTLLQWLAVSSARGAFPEPLAAWNATTPFLLQLRRYVDRPLPAVDEFISSINRHLSQPEGWTQRQLADGEALVLVDGVDELPDEKRAEAREWLIDLVEAYPNARYVVTSRPPAVGEDWLANHDFEAVLLEPMELGAIRAFIDHWYAAALTSLSDPDEMQELGELRDQLKEIVRETRAIRNLASSPLLCAMLCALNRDRRAKLPSDRLELYRIALEMLLERRDIERRVESDAGEIALREKEILLRTFALWLLNNEKSDALKSELEALVAARLEGMPRVDASASEIVEHLVLRSGVLRQPVEGRVDYIHRTFQEYLAAQEAVETLSMGLLVQHAHLDQWQEVVVLAAGLASLSMREELIRGLIDRGDCEPKVRHRVHLLAVGCLDTSAELPLELSAKVNALLAGLIPPRTLTEARAIASAGEVAVPLLGRHAGRKTKAVVAAACVRALTHIGGESALVQLEKFGSDRRVTVARELLRAWNEFPQEEFARRVLAPSVLEYGACTISSPTQLAGAQYLEELSSLTCEGAADLTPGDAWPWAALGGCDALNELSLEAIPALTHVPAVGKANQLRTLRLTRLPDLTEFSAQKLPQLDRLSLQWCPQLEDVSGVEAAESLVALQLGGCAALRQMPRPPASLRRVYLNDLSLSSLGPLAGHPALEMLSLRRCGELQSLDGVEASRALEVLSLAGAGSLEGVESVGELPELEVLGVRDLPRVADVSALGACEQLRILAIEDAPLVSGLDWVMGLTGMVRMSFAGCTGIEGLPSLALPALSRLNLSGCSGLLDFEGLEGARSVKHLNLDGCTGLADLRPLSGLSELSHLTLSQCEQIDDLSPLLELPKLRWLDLRGCSEELDASPFEARNGMFLQRGSFRVMPRRLHEAFGWSWETDSWRYPS
jgi:NACHT domain